MERIFLYYPTIKIPQNEWLYNSILYSDKVSSILPFKNLTYLPDSIKFLLDEEQYHPIFVRDFIDNYQEEFSEFEDKFIEAIDDKRFFFKSSDTPRDEQFQGIYYDKITKRVLDELDKRKLITKKIDKLYMPENAAIYYMSILAQFIAKVDINNLLVPSSDYKRFTDITFENGKHKREAFKLILDSCLPVPEPAIDIKEIIKFKKRHNDDLLRFRMFLSELVLKINNLNNEQDIKELLISSKEKIELELKYLHTAYNKSKLKTIVISLSSLISLENPKLIGTLIAAGLISTNINPAIGISIAGVGIIGKWVDSYFDRNDKLKSNELNYLFEAKSVGIIK